MSKITIVEGNSNDKDNVRNFMVKGEPGNDGVSPSVSVSRGTDKATIEVTDAEGTTSADVFDGVSPTVSASKSNRVTTITITDKDGTETTEINDGVDLTGGVPTNGVIAFDGVQADIPDGYEVSSTSIATLTNSYSTSTSEGYSANYINSKLPKITSLWSGSKSTTGTITLSEAYTNYDFLLVGIQAQSYSKSSELIPVSDIEQSTDSSSNTYEITIFQSTSVYSNISVQFTNSTTLNILQIHYVGWNNCTLKYVIGIKL